MACTDPVQLGCCCVDPEECEEEKSPVIFLHGFAECKEHWHDIPAKVANQTKRKVFALDARDHGDSEWTNEFNFTLLVDDVLNFMDTMSIPKCVLVGHSMGGLTAMNVALKAPERIERLVVEDIGFHKVPDEIAAVWPVFLKLGLEALPLVPETADEKAAQQFIANFVYDACSSDVQKCTSTEELAGGFEMARDSEGKIRFRNNLKILKNLGETVKTIPPRNPDITYDKSTLFFYGTASPIKLYDHIDELKETFPNSEFVAIEGAGHCVHEERPKEFTISLLEFLERE